ncbi:hypothetical protein EON63_18020 [archaeon]|nr:MAG: hypothetical protein EON63_18020 [archaeon]
MHHTLYTIYRIPYTIIHKPCTSHRQNIYNFPTFPGILCQVAGGVFDDRHTGLLHGEGLGLVQERGLHMVHDQSHPVLFFLVEGGLLLLELGVDRGDYGHGYRYVDMCVYMW